MMNDIGQSGLWTGIVGRRWDDSLVLEAMSQFVGPALIRQVLTATGKKSQRIRRLLAAAVVWLVIAMSIYRSLDIPSPWRQVVGTLAALWLAGTSHRPPCPSAFSAPVGTTAARRAADAPVVLSYRVADRNRSDARARGRVLSWHAFDGDRRRAFQDR